MPRKKKTANCGNTEDGNRSIREAAEKKISETPEISSGLARKTPEQLIHELEVHQIELEMQADQLKSAQLQLEESRDSYLDLYDFAPVGLLTLSSRALIKEVNLTAAKLLGVPRNKLVNHGLGKFIAPADLGVWDHYFIQTLNEVGKQACTITLKRGDGLLFPARLESFRIHGFEEGAITIRMAISDITEIKLKEEALRAASKYTRTLIETSLDPLVVISTDGKITDVNNATESITGVSRERLIGSDFSYYFTEPEKARAGYMKVLEEGHITDYLLAIRHPSGRITDVQTNAAVYRNARGEVAGVFAAARDITERKRAEEALQLFKSVFDQANEACAITDPSGRFLYINEAHEGLFGVPFEEARTLNYRDYYPRESVEVLEQQVVPLLERGESWEGELEVFDAAGRKFPIWERAGSILDPSGKLLYSFGFMHDITERKMAEQAIRIANKKLNLLSSITRHDINNQITVLWGYLAQLEKKQQDPLFDTYYGKVRTSAERISAMIRFTREYENIGVHAPAWQDCHTLVDNATGQVSLGQVMVKNDFPAGTEVFADPLIEKVFYNLMDNAVRYGGKIMTIRFSVEWNGDSQTIVCGDDGEGIPADDKEHIFEHGFGKNTGLGLAISRDILDITGITIRETGEPGKGARFEMTMPKGTWRLNPDTR